MRASVSHRVVFDGAPVLAVLGAPGAIAQEPWFARDAVRTAATWAGAADAAADEAVRLLAARPEPSDLERLAAGRIRAEQRTIGLWLAEGGRRGDAGTLRREDGAYLRHVIATAHGAALLDEAARACGSHPFTTGGGAGPRAPRPRALHAPAPPRPDRRARRSGRAGGGAVSVDPATFERMYRDEEDPWGFGTSPYEAAKYDADDRGARRPAVPPRPGARLLDRRADGATGRALRRADRAGHVGDRRRAGARARRRRTPTCASRRCPRAARRAVRPRRRQRGPLLLRAPTSSTGCSTTSRPRWSPAACCSRSTGGRRRGRTRCAATRSTRSSPRVRRCAGSTRESHELYRLDVLERT